MSYFTKISTLSLSAIASIMVTSCSNDEPVTYKEKIVIDNQTVPARSIAPVQPKSTAVTQDQPQSIDWTVPTGWGAERSNGMVIAKFQIPQIQDSKCYITKLRGNGGGLEPNLQRWFRQIQLPAITDKTEMAAFIAKQDQFSIDNGKVVVIDFTPLGTDDNSSSMIVGVVTFADITLYVKLQGPKTEISKHKQELISLTKSITRN